MEVLAVAPEDATARRALAEIAFEQTTRTIELGLSRDKTVRLIIPVSQLKDLFAQWQRPADAFVLSRLAAGASTVAALLAVCPMTEAEVLGILRAAVEERVIQIG